MKSLSVEQMSTTSFGMTKADCERTAKARWIASTLCGIGCAIPIIGAIIFGTTSAILIGVDGYCVFFAE